MPQPPRPSVAAPPAATGKDLAPRILLLVAGQNAASVYLKRLGELGAVCETAANIAELTAKLRAQPYNGIVLDVPTLIKDKSYDKRLIAEAMDFFPLLRARVDAAGGAILALSPGGAAATGNVLADFVLARCAAFPARRIRAGERAGLCLNVLVHGLAPGEPKIAPGRSCVLDVSSGGCFVWDFDPPPAGVALRLEFTGRSGQPCAAARVIWRQPWGERPAPPGAGLEFTELPAELASWIAALIDKSSAPH
ncbi:MAG: hypothetical protein HQK81_04915 [Desulfovibrionaceae bacterium]|nr:hypothetical protein [Desulfovibrionaceae bacterium]